jgi:hypothetical protein
MIYPPKVLLICGTHPAEIGVGELFMRDLVEGFPCDLIRYSLTPSSNPLQVGSWLKHKSIICRYGASRYPIISSILHKKFEDKMLEKVIFEIEEVVSVNNIDTVWIILSSTALISLASKLVEKLNVRICSSVWDLPEYFYKNQSFSKAVVRKVNEQFEASIKKSDKVSVISEAMYQLMENKYGVKTTIIRHGVSKLLTYESRESEGTIKIAFAGSLYAKREWNALISALEAYKWNIAGKTVELFFIGRFPRLGAIKGSKTQFVGVKSFSETIELLSSMDIGYLPYWFSRRRALEATNSFPGKISAYAAAGVKVLFHAPEYSSVAHFLKNYPFGMNCSSLDKKDVIATICELINNKEFCRNAESARCEALDRELGQKAMLDRFKAFMLT